MIPWSEVEDAGLVSLARAGDQDACRELVRRFERPVLTLVQRMVRDRELARELAQETFVKAFGALARYDAAHKLSSWLFKIAHNTTIDHLRRRQPETVSLTEPADGEPGFAGQFADEGTVSPEAAALRSDLGRALEQVLGKLRPEYREVMVLRFYEGLAYEEIAEVTGLPLGTVKTHIHRARKEMADGMRQAGWAPPGARGERAETRGRGFT